jgi:hypothetical protein
VPTANLLKHHRLAKSISDAGWRALVSILHAQAAYAGRRGVAVPLADTSQRCSGPTCGILVAKSLSVRWHACPDCGTTLHWDHNAARNSERLGRSLREAVALAAAQNRESRGLSRGECQQLPLATWVMDYSADEDWYDSLLAVHAAENAGGVNVQAADAPAAQANATVDPWAAETLYQRAEQLYVNAVAWIVLDQPYDSYVMSHRVVGYAENDAGLSPTAVRLSVYVAA